MRRNPIKTYLSRDFQLIKMTSKRNGNEEKKQQKKKGKGGEKQKRRGKEGKSDLFLSQDFIQDVT